MADPHCKTPAHLRVGALISGSPRTSTLTVQYVSPMACHNRPTEEDWGIVLSKRGQSLEGLHLRPDAAAWMPTQLRAAAATSKAVLISHTIGGTVEPFAAITAAQALSVAAGIEALL